MGDRTPGESSDDFASGIVIYVTVPGPKGSHFQEISILAIFTVLFTTHVSKTAKTSLVLNSKCVVC